MKKNLKHLLKDNAFISSKITYEILNYARSHKNKTIDDMSVIALKIIAN